MTQFTPTLYYYQHCPYCLRVLTFIGLADIDVQTVALLNDDEETPINMVGKKMVPILQFKPQQYMGESLDIIQYLSEQKGFSVSELPEQQIAVEQFLSDNREAIYSLSMPRWVKFPLPEFATQSAIDYFTEKKSQMIGDFDVALQNTEQFTTTLQQSLADNPTLFTSLSEQPNSLPAIMLFSALHGLSSVKELAWSAEAENFMVLMAKQSKVALYTN